MGPLFPWNRGAFAATDNSPSTPSTITGRLTSGLAFRDQAGGDFPPVASSSTINSGAAGQSVGRLDLNGNLRTVGAAPDMGAFEQVPAPPVPPRARLKVPRLPGQNGEGGI